MTKYLVMLFSLMLLGCGMKDKNEFRVDPALLPYYEVFVQSSSIRGNNQSTNDLIMEFGPTEGRVIAYCQKQIRYNDSFLQKTEKVDTPQVVVNPNWWKNASEPSRREVIYHELGHCLMNKDHDTRLSSYARQPESLMYPYHIGGSFFAYWENNYLDELFGLRQYALSEPDGQPATIVASTEPFSGVKTVIYTSTLDGCEEDEHIIEEEEIQPESEG